MVPHPERGVPVASLIERGLKPDTTFYIQYMESGKARRVSTGTGNLKIAEEKLRQFESAPARGEPSSIQDAHRSGSQCLHPAYPHGPHAQVRRRKSSVIAAMHFEAITKGQISSFIDGLVSP